MYTVLRTVACGGDVVVGTYNTREEAERVCSNYSFGYIVKNA